MYDMPKAELPTTKESTPEELQIKLFAANYMLKNPKAKPREVRRATEKALNIKIK